MLLKHSSMRDIDLRVSYDESISTTFEITIRRHFLSIMELALDREGNVYKSCESLMSALTKAQNDLVRCRTQIYSLEEILIHADDYGSNSLSIPDCQSSICSPDATKSMNKSNNEFHLLKCTLGSMKKDKKMFMGKLKSVLHAQILLQDQVRKLQDQILNRNRDEPVNTDAVKKGSMLFSEVKALQIHMNALEKELSPIVQEERRRPSTSRSFKEDLPTTGTNNNNSMRNIFHSTSPINQNYVYLTQEIQKLRTAAELVLQQRSPSIKHNNYSKVRFDLRHSRKDHFVTNCTHIGRSTKNCYKGDRRKSWPTTRRRQSSTSCSPSPLRGSTQTSPVRLSLKVVDRCTSPHSEYTGKANFTDHRSCRKSGKVTISRGTSPIKDAVTDDTISEGEMNNNMSTSQSQCDSEATSDAFDSSVKHSSDGKFPCAGDMMEKSPQAHNHCEVSSKGTATPTLRRRSCKVQTRNIGHRRSVACQAESSTDPPPEPVPKQVSERANQTEAPKHASLATQTELIRASIRLQTERPNVRSHGVQISPPRARISMPHDHHQCPRYRCKSPIAYYRSCGDCRCHSRPTSPNRVSEEGFY